MNMKPFFSIVLPTYNRGRFLKAALNSVLGQSYADWELIVVDDGSTDNTKEIIASFKDDRIKYIYQSNAERSAARNNGVASSIGKWVCFLDSDDEYLNTHLSTLFSFISAKNIEYGMLFTGHLIRQGGELVKHPLIDDKSGNVLKEIWTKFILMNSVCVSREIIEQNKFNEDFRIWEDTHLWLRIAQKYPIYQIPEYTCIQNVHDQNSVSKGMAKVEMVAVNQYICAIRDYYSQYNSSSKGTLTLKDFQSYIDIKYRMFLYRSRQNRQSSIALRIWAKAIFHKPSFYLLSEFPKIILNSVKIGIDAK